MDPVCHPHNILSRVLGGGGVYLYLIMLKPVWKIADLSTFYVELRVSGTLLAGHVCSPFHVEMRVR